MSHLASSSSSPAAPSLKDKARLPHRPGKAILNRSDFVVRIPVLSARLQEEKIGELKKEHWLREWLMDIPKARSILNDPADVGVKLLRLRVQSEEQIPATIRNLLAARGASLVRDTIELDYDFWTASDILNSILPTFGSDEAPSSFTQTGHIGHVNLREEWLPYKHIIGQVILDKNPKLRTVVNKLNTIHAEYRYFDMEVLAGDHDFVTTVNESTCSFTFDFRHVYWNSRLHHEHERLVSLFSPGQVVADVMAGVGPFAIPAAKKGCYVFGNDLNPESVRWMRENRRKNHVETTLRPSEIDGREFIRRTPLESWTNPFSLASPPKSRNQREREARIAREARAASSRSPSVPQLPTAGLAGLSISSIEEAADRAEPDVELQQIDHFVLNLPDSALTFLDAFPGSYAPLLSQPGYDRAHAKMPMVHVYCFTRELEPGKAEEDICSRATQYLGHTVTSSCPDFALHLVRSVAPNKEMYCLSFRLDRGVAFGVTA